MNDSMYLACALIIIIVILYYYKLIIVYTSSVYRKRIRDYNPFPEISLKLKKEVLTNQKIYIVLLHFILKTVNFFIW